MSIFDLDNYTDAVSNAVDSIGDSGDFIGEILKSVSPILGTIPGVGTAFAVAVYAAGAISARDNITDAMIGTASAAMPPGIPRIAFDGATNITKDIVEGRSILTSTLMHVDKQPTKQAELPLRRHSIRVLRLSGEIRSINV